MSDQMEKTVISRWQFGVMQRSMCIPKGGLEKWLNSVNVWVEPKPKIQAKHIPDEAMVLIIKQLKGMPGMYGYPGGIQVFRPAEHTTVNITDICNLYPSVPRKVIMAKLRRLVKRGVIDGCTCGCRGDFKVIGK